MEKVDYSKLVNEIEAAKKAPVLNTYGATLKVNVISENQALAEETMQMLIDYFNRFNDVNIVKAVWDE